MPCGARLANSLLRVLHIDSGLGWRGGQRQVYLLATGMRKLGHEPVVIAPPESPLLARARAAGLAAVAVGARGDWDLVAVRRIRARIRAWKPHVVHAHDARSHALALLALGTNATMPLVVTRRVPFSPKSVRTKYGHRVTRFVAISEAVRGAMVEAGIQRDRIELVHSGVPSALDVVPRNWREENSWPAESVVCAVVGAMTREKGIGAIDRILDALPSSTSSRLRIVLMGGEPAPPRTHRGATIIATGFIEAIQEAIAGVDILLHPSEAEGLGTSILDAMSLGIPPVAFATGGIPETVQHEQCGLLAPAGDFGALARELGRLIDNAGFRRSLGNRGRERAVEFSDTLMTKLNVAVYHKVLGSSILDAQPGSSA